LGEKFADGEFVVADTLPDGAGADTLFLTHQAGFFSQGRYTIGTIKEGGEEDSYDIAPWPTLDGAPKPTGVAAAYLVMNKKSEVKDAAWNFMSAYLDVDGQTFRLGEGGNAVPSIIGADNVVLDGYPAHAQTFLDARDNGFEDHITDGSVPGLSGDVSALFLELYQGKADATTTLNSVADLIASKQNEG
jgi:multiple sugar transport system substrate-binding protein